MSKKTVMIALLAGAAAGALAGILFAPDKGEKTRKKISRKSQKTIKDIKSSFGGIADSLAHRFSKANGEMKQKHEKIRPATS